MTDYVRLSHEALLDLQRTIQEANKQTLNHKLGEQEQILKILNKADATELLGVVCKKLDENNTALRILATQIHKLQETLHEQTTLLKSLAPTQPEETNQQ